MTNSARNPAKSRRISSLPEREQVRRIAKAAATGSFPQLETGIGDDAAVLALPRGHQIVVTTDFSLEGTHFRRDWHSPESAGHRCLARGLSDLAAMGADPLAAFLSLAVPAGISRPWLDGFFGGLLALAAQYQIPLAGGDLAASPGKARSARVLADVVLLGSVPKGRALLRSSAQPGDSLYVTGTLGGAAAELASLSINSAPSKILRRLTGPTDSHDHPHLFPQPRIAAGLALRTLNQRIACPIACMDISDGLAIDLSRLCEASSKSGLTLAAELDAHAIPLAPDATLQQALTGGEDYELLFTAPPSAKISRQIGGLAITRIGRIVTKKPRQPQLTLLLPNGSRKPLPAQGWEYQM